MNRTDPSISMPGTKGVGPLDPVIRTLDLMRQIFVQAPLPVAGTEASRSTSALIGIHLLHLLQGCGLLNGLGFHSAAVSLFRPMEDALDCLAAVSMVPEAAEKWQQQELKASDAANLWTPLALDMEPRNVKLPDYRKSLRRDFNIYSHCSPVLCEWNLYFKPFKDSPGTGTLVLNQLPHIIDANGHAIDAYETAHVLETVLIVKNAYSQYLSTHKDALQTLNSLTGDVEEIMRKHDEHGCQEVRVPPEVSPFRSTLSDDKD